MLLVKFDGHRNTGAANSCLILWEYKLWPVLAEHGAGISFPSCDTSQDMLATAFWPVLRFHCQVSDAGQTQQLAKMASSVSFQPSSPNSGNECMQVIKESLGTSRGRESLITFSDDLGPWPKKA